MAPGARHKQKPVIIGLLYSGPGFRYSSHMLSQQKSTVQSKISAPGRHNIKLGLQGCPADVATRVTSTCCPAAAQDSGLPNPVCLFRATTTPVFTVAHQKQQQKSHNAGPSMGLLPSPLFSTNPEGYHSHQPLPGRQRASGRRWHWHQWDAASGFCCRWPTSPGAALLMWAGREREVSVHPVRRHQDNPTPSSHSDSG